MEFHTKIWIMKSKDIIKMLIADDHPIFRQGLKHAFSEYPNMEVTGEVSNCVELLKEIKKNNYDIVLLDISMGGMNSLDTLKQLRVF